MRVGHGTGFLDDDEPRRVEAVTSESERRGMEERVGDFRRNGFCVLKRMRKSPKY
jgi:hypothetical protein